MVKYTTRARPFAAGFLALALYDGAAAAQDPAALVLPRTNPPATVSQRIGVTDVAIKYNRPSVKGRRVFGALVPFDHVWRTGSDEATTITFSTDVTFQKAAVPAGTYALFTIPANGTWTIILNTQPAQWGSYSHNPAADFLRVKATPVDLGSSVESLTMTLDDVTARSAILNIAWERTRVPVRIEVDVVRLTVPRIEASMKAAGRKPYFMAAMFYFENGLDLGLAAEWMAAALQESPGHIGMLHRQSLILERKGDRVGALAAAEASLAGAAKSPPELRQEYTRLNTPLIARLKRQP